MSLIKLFALAVASMVECALHQEHAHVHLDGQAMIADKVKKHIQYRSIVTLLET